MDLVTLAHAIINNKKTTALTPTSQKLAEIFDLVGCDLDKFSKISGLIRDIVDIEVKNKTNPENYLTESHRD